MAFDGIFSTKQHKMLHHIDIGIFSTNLFYQLYMMNNIFFIALILFSQALMGQNIEGFSFNDFASGEISTKKVPVNLSSHPLGSKYKSVF